MRFSFLLLAGANLLLLAVTAVVGLLVDGDAWFFQHFALGLLSAIYTCLVHVLVFTYFVVSLNVARQAVAQSRADPALLPAVHAGKSRALRAALAAIGATLVASGLGAIITEPSLARAWHVSVEAHLLSAFALIGVNFFAFVVQYAEIDRNVRRFEAAFGNQSPTG